MKINDVCFVRAGCIDSYQICADEISKLGGLREQLIIKQKPMIAVKYLGNGLFKEMVTGTKIGSLNLKVETQKYGSEEHLEDCKFDEFGKIVSYEKYLKSDGRQNDTEELRNRFIEHLEKLINKISESPLFFNFGTILVYDIDNEKNEFDYLSHEDEITKFFKKAEKIALKEAKKTINLLQKEIELTRTVSNKRLRLAHLENRLRDFANND